MREFVAAEGVTVHPDGVSLDVKDGAITARLLVDCMGNFGPIVRQVQTYVGTMSGHHTGLSDHCRLESSSYACILRVAESVLCVHPGKTRAPWTAAPQTAFSFQDLPDAACAARLAPMTLLLDTVSSVCRHGGAASQTGCAWWWAPVPGASRTIQQVSRMMRQMSCCVCET